MRAEEPGAQVRTRSSLAVSADDCRWLLQRLAGPASAEQLQSPPHPKDGLRHSPISGVVLTNGDNDHVAGLLSLRESSPLVVSATTRVHAVLWENSVFNVLNPNLVQRLEEAPKDVIVGLEYIKR